MKRIHFAGIAAALALLLAAGCGSYPFGGNNNPYPTNPNTYPPQQSASSDMQGIVNSVDTRAQRIDMTVNAVNGRSNNPYRTSVYYNSQTQVLYQSRNYSPANLETGDQIDVTLNYNNGQSVADTITVTGDSRNQGAYPSGTYPPSYPPNTYPQGTYPNNSSQYDIQGTVSYVDTTAQRIDVTSAYASNLRNSAPGGTSYSIFYNANTPVYWNGQTYRPTDLERGDQIDARVTNNGGQVQVNTITVTRNVRQ